MRRKLSLSAKSMAVSLLLAGGIAIGGVSTSEAATFYGGYNNSTVVVTDDSSVVYPGDGTARMYLTQSYGGNSFYYLVEVNPNDKRVYILDNNGHKKLDGHGRYIMIGDYDIVKQMMNYYFKVR